MKTIIYIATLLFAITALTSCEYADDSGIGVRKTESGKLVYDETFYTIRGYLEIVNLSQTIDRYLTSTGAVRDSIKFYHLQGYDILEMDDNIIHVNSIDRGTALRIHRNSSEPLTSPLTEWDFEGTTSRLLIFKDDFIITSQAEADVFHIKAKGLQIYSSNTISSVELKVQAKVNSEQPDLITNNYIVTMLEDKVGEISVYQGKHFKTTFKITTPIESLMGAFVEGRIEMEAFRSSGVKDLIVAELEHEGLYVSISFKGVTERW